jgi:hypothetical protein
VPDVIVAAVDVVMFVAVAACVAIGTAVPMLKWSLLKLWLFQ